MPTYKLRAPTLEHLRCAARWLRQLDDQQAESAADIRSHCARVALSPKWRCRDRLTEPLWPAQTADNIHVWAAIGASDALSMTPPRTIDTRPHSLAYTAAWTAVMGAYMQGQQHEMTRQERRAIMLEDLRNDLVKAGPTYGALLEASESELLRFLTEAEHVVTTSKNDALLLADRNSLLVALGEAAADRLSVNPTMGEAYLIVRKGKVCYQSGYKGLVRLAYRSGMIDSLHVDVVYGGEHYQRTGGTTPGIEHVPDDSKRTGKLEDIVGAYAVVWLIGSSRPMFRAITHATIIEAAEASGDPRSKSYSNVWRDHAEAMAWKTAIIRCANQLPRTDKFSAFHAASSRAVLREANVEPHEIAGLDDLRALPPSAPALPPAPEPPPPRQPRDNPTADSIRSRRIALATLTGDSFTDVYRKALAYCRVPAVEGQGGVLVAPEPEQLSPEHAAAVDALLKKGLDSRSQERQPGDDDDVDPTGCP